MTDEPTTNALADVTTPATPEPTDVVENVDTTPESPASTDESSPEGDVEESSEGGETESIDGSGTAQNQGRRKPRAEERIQEVIAREKATREYAEYWREQAKALMESRKAQGPETPAQTEDPPPTLAQFKHNADAWAQAMSEWTQREVARQAERVAAQKIQQVKQAETEQTVRAQFAERAARFAEEHVDFDIVVGNPRLPITPTMGEVIMNSDIGPALAYHLGTNPGEAARISRLPAAQQAAALGRLEAKLANAPAAPAAPPAPKKQGSKAPPPPNPIGGAGKPPAIDLENCPIDQYVQIRMEQRAKALGLR